MREVEELSKAALRTLITRLAVLGLSAIATILTARLLGPAGRGTYAETTALIYLTAAVLTAGAGTANVYFAAASRQPIHNLIGNSLLLGLLSVPVGAGVGLLASLTVMVGDGPAWIGAAIVGSSIVLAVMNSLVVAMLLGLNLVNAYNRVAVLQASLAAGLLTVLLIVPDRGAIHALIAFTVALVGGLGVAWFELTSGRLDRRPSINLESLRTSLTFARWWQLGALVQLVNSRVPLFIVDYLGSRAHAGQLSIAMALAEALASIPHGLAIPLFAATAQAGNTSTARERAARASRIGVISIIVLTIPALVAAPVASPVLFGPRFSEVPILLALLGPGMVATAPLLTSSSYLSGLGLPRLTAMPVGINLVVNVISEFLLVPQYGAAGAAISISIATTFASAAVLRAHARTSGMSWSDLVVPRRSDLETIVHVIHTQLQALFGRKVRDIGRTSPIDRP